MMDEPQPILNHMIDLRRRLIISFVALMVGFGICYSFAPEIYGFLVKPLANLTEGEGRRLIYTGLTEAFFTYLKLAFWGGAILAFPVIATQLWLFIAPALFDKERSTFLPFLIATPFLFVMGAAMAYFLVFPMAWQFFLSFESAPAVAGMAIELEPRVSEYLSLSMTLIFAFGIAFQLPVLLLLLVKSGIITVDQLRRFRRFALVLIVTAAAVLTPPDVISQICLALPLWALYEVALILAKRIEPKKA